MAAQSFERLRALNNWKLSSGKAGATRRGLAATADTFLEKLVASGRLEVVDRAGLQSQPRRGIPTAAQLEMKADPRPFLCAPGAARIRRHHLPLPHAG